MSPKTNGSAPDLSLVIPCFNESENVVLVAKRLAELLPEAGVRCEVFFVDGGSNDGTPENLRSAIAELGLDNVNVIDMPERRGYGYDIIFGLRQTRAPVLAWTHADMQTDLRDVFDAYLLFQSHSGERILVKGARKNRAFLEVFFTFGMQVFAFLVLKKYLRDINAQPKMFSRDFFENHLQNGAPDDFSLDLFAYYKASSAGYRVLTIPVVFAKRMHGTAKGGGGSWTNKKNLIKRTYKYILKLRESV